MKKKLRQQYIETKGFNADDIDTWINTDKENPPDFSGGFYLDNKRIGRRNWN